MATADGKGLLARLIEAGIVPEGAYRLTVVSTLAGPDRLTYMHGGSEYPVKNAGGFVWPGVEIPRADDIPNIQTLPPVDNEGSSNADRDS